MILKRTNNIWRNHNTGFTIIEIMVVISIIVVLSTLAVPSVFAYRKRTKEEVCNISCLKVKKLYEAHLELEDIKDSDTEFQKFLNQYGSNVCPDHGVITYVDGEVKCSIHMVENEDVPFLD